MQKLLQSPRRRSMHDGMNTPDYRLPRAVEVDARGGAVRDALARASRPLRRGGEIFVLEVDYSDALVAALKAANLAGRLVRGIDGVERALDAETKGQQRADRAAGTPRGGRVSRLLLVSDDGSDGLYKRVEKLLARHAPRVLVIRVRADAGAMATPLYGPGRTARLVLVAHKDAVSAVLLAVVP